jgi:hypothetical protein
MMKKKVFFTGSVFQFYVQEIKKYAFCKYYDFTHVSSFHGLLAKVFDKLSDSENNTMDCLKDADWLFGYRSVHKWPDLRKNTGWKSLGIINAEEDTFIPDFKDVQAFPYVVKDESQIGPWQPVINLTETGENCAYEKVHHLETIILTSKLGIERRTGMEYCRINNLKVENCYDLSDEANESMYLQMINVPVYSTIPKEIRGKALV